MVGDDEGATEAATSSAKLLAWKSDALSTDDNSDDEPAVRLINQAKPRRRTSGYGSATVTGGKHRARRRVSCGYNRRCSDDSESEEDMAPVLHRRRRSAIEDLQQRLDESGGEPDEQPSDARSGGS